MVVSYTVYQKSPAATVLSITGSILLFSGIYLAFGSFSAKNDTSSMLVFGLVFVALGVLFMFLAGKLNKRVVEDKWKKALADPVLRDHITKSSLAAYALYKNNPCDAMIQFIGPFNPFAATRILDIAHKKITEDQALEMMRRYDSIDSPGNLPDQSWMNYSNGEFTLTPVRNSSEIRQDNQKILEKLENKDRRFAKAMTITGVLCGFMLVLGMVLMAFQEEKVPQAYDGDRGTYCMVDVVKLEDSSYYSKNDKRQIYDFVGANGEYGSILISRETADQVEDMLSEGPVRMYGSITSVKVESQFSPRGYDKTVWKAGLEPEKDAKGAIPLVLGVMLLFATGILWLYKRENKGKMKPYQIG